VGLHVEVLDHKEADPGPVELARNDLDLVALSRRRSTLEAEGGCAVGISY
jgi:hypothetical protein